MNLIDRVVCLGIDSRRNEFWPSLRSDCKECTGLPLDIFVAGNGEEKGLIYDHVDLPYDPRMNQYVGYSPSDRIHVNFNIFVCHKKILAKAIEANENILLMEDDGCFIVDRWHEVWNSDEVKDFSEGNAWDALFLGYFQRQYEGDEVHGTQGEASWRENGTVSIKRAQPNVPGRISGLHGVILNKNFLRTLYDECNVSPLDGFINRNLNRFRIWYLEPQIIGCLPNYSFCEGSFTDRKHFWE